jgi:hypothetical protein
MEHPVSVLVNFLTYMLPANNKLFFPSSTLILIMSYNNSVSILIETSAGQLQHLISAPGRGRHEIGKYHQYGENASPSLSLTAWYGSSICFETIICIVILILSNQIITETRLQSMSITAHLIMETPDFYWTPGTSPWSQQLSLVLSLSHINLVPSLLPDFFF